MDLQVKLLADDLNSISKSHDRWEEPTPKVALWPPHPCVLYTSVSMSVMNLFISSYLGCIDLEIHLFLLDFPPWQNISF